MIRRPSRLALFFLFPLVWIIAGCNPIVEFDPTKHYRIIGDIGPLTEDWSKGKVEIHHRIYDEQGARDVDIIAETKTSDGKFEIVGEIEEPAVVRIYALADDVPLNFAYAVLETGAEITVSHPSKTMGLIADGTGTHKMLLSSWQFGDEFQNAVAHYGVLLEEKRALQEKAEAEAEVQGTDETQSDTEIQDVADASEESSQSNDVAQIDSSEEADEEPATEEASQDAAEESKEVDPTYEAYLAVKEIEGAALEVFALGDDPQIALLAIELGGLGEPDKNITRLEELAELLPVATVESRVRPRIASMKSYQERVAANEALGVGKTAPNFTAPSLTGGDMTLNDVLAENKVVLVDFWASWCGPCIKTFPHLKEMYSELNDQGFEIVSVSIDDVDEDWQEASDEHELPWINLGDISKGDGPVAMAYGVTFIPKAYVVDSSGEIVGKDVKAEELEDFVREFIATASTVGDTAETVSALELEEASPQGS